MTMIVVRSRKPHEIAVLSIGSAVLSIGSKVRTLGWKTEDMEHQNVGQAIEYLEKRYEGRSTTRPSTAAG